MDSKVEEAIYLFSSSDDAHSEFNISSTNFYVNAFLRVKSL
jgi:hypothetical protein